MTFTPGRLPGIWLIDLAPREDDRGCLLKLFDFSAFAAAGLNTEWRQTLITRTTEAGTIRGMHWQDEPHPEIKLVTCLSGRIWDCVVDIRPESPTYGQWEAFELSAENPRGIYIPTGCAHGLQTLEPDSEVHYHISAQYIPHLQRGFPWNDIRTAINWPRQGTKTVSARDHSHANFPW